MTEDSKKILITGGTGFIGSYLSEELMRCGHFLTILTRSPEKYDGENAKNQKFIGWDAPLVPLMEQTDIVINLAGENLFGQRWTDEVKKKLYHSRIDTTAELVNAISKSVRKPELLISGSGVNVYEPQGDEPIDESYPEGHDFLAQICIDWEAEARKAEQDGVRVVIIRTGIVLEKDGGVIGKMKLPFTLFAGGSLGSGKQYFPWIHMDDMCRAINFLIENEQISGAVNATAPAPVTMDELAGKMGKVMNRPSFFRVPEFALKIALGEAAQPVLSSLRIEPKALLDAGFQFRFTDLEEALGDIL